MFQKFNTDTLMSRFIKNLLSKERIPLLECVSDGDIIISGCLYIYRHVIIKCKDSGILLVDKEERLFPSDNLYPSNFLFAQTGIHLASFNVIHYYDPDDCAQFSYRYNSNIHWYDKETHKHLGNYLRYLRDYKDLNLMPFYNCYSSYELSDVYICNPAPEILHPDERLPPSPALYPNMQRSYRNSSSKTYSFGSLPQHKVYAVPIRFGRTYTIAIDCPTEVQLRSIIYGESGMVRCNDLTEEEARNKFEYYTDLIQDSYVFKSCSQFNNPFTYCVETTDIRLYQRQKDLYLLIQLPVSCDSTITVLEGDYTNMGAVTTDSFSIRTYDLYKNLSLLKCNSHETYAFSNRLIEYLLLNVITHLEELTTNISKVQQALSKLDSTYNLLVTNQEVSFGVWNEGIKHAVLRVIEDASDNDYFEDQDGFINKDVEKLFMKKGAKI